MKNEEKSLLVFDWDDTIAKRKTSSADDIFGPVFDKRALTLLRGIKKSQTNGNKFDLAIVSNANIVGCDVNITSEIVQSELSGDFDDKIKLLKNIFMREFARSCDVGVEDDATFFIDTDGKICIKGTENNEEATFVLQDAGKNFEIFCKENGIDKENKDNETNLENYIEQCKLVYSLLKDSNVYTFVAKPFCKKDGKARRYMRNHEVALFDIKVNKDITSVLVPKECEDGKSRFQYLKYNENDQSSQEEYNNAHFNSKYNIAQYKKIFVFGDSLTRDMGLTISFNQQEQKRPETEVYGVWFSNDVQLKSKIYDEYLLQIVFGNSWESKTNIIEAPDSDEGQEVINEKVLPLLGVRQEYDYNKAIGDSIRAAYEEDQRDGIPPYAVVEASFTTPPTPHVSQRG